MVELIDNLRAYYKCDESSGNLLDAHGSFNLTDVNTVGSAAGKINGGRDFRLAQSEQFVSSVTTIDDIITNAYTISVWIKITALGDYLTVLRNEAGLANSGFALDITPTGNIRAFQHSGALDITTGATVLSTGVWHYVSAVYNGATLKVYLNGVEDGSSLCTGNITNSPANLEVGGLNFEGSPLYHFNGVIDELGIWTRNLSVSELLQLYNSGNGLAYPFTVPGDETPRRKRCKGWFFPSLKRGFEHYVGLGYR